MTNRTRRFYKCRNKLKYKKITLTFDEKTIVIFTFLISCSLMISELNTNKPAIAQQFLPIPPVVVNPTFAAAATSCNILAISGVTASGSQIGNPATNAMDVNLSTRWANLGIGSSITLDFSKERSICGVDISWYNGNQRTSNFVISVSIDGKSFTTVFSGKSSGKTTGFESYDFPDRTGRYVKITVNGNSINDWASISEIKVLGNLINSDAIPPSVINSSPDSGATGVAITSSITATFSEPVQSWSSPAIFTVKNGAGTGIAGTLSSSTDAKTVTFKPSSSLGFSTSYTVTITTGVKDKAGNAMTADKTWSFVTTAGNTPPPPSPPTSNACNKLSISKITEAGGTPSLGPKYAIDGNLATRWSEQGLGSSLTLDIGKKKTICNLEVSWYRGTERISNFVIGLSNDGKSFTNVFSGTSSGTTNGFERYEFTDRTARYVKITVNGNTLNDWASILEISVFGDPNNIPAPTPTPTPTPPPSDGTLNIAAVGDWSCSSQAQSTLENIVQKTPEVVLALGDLSYKDTPDCWLKLIGPIKSITKFSMGNHEEDEGSPSSLPSSYLEEFGLGTSYYSFNYRNIHFLMLNSEIAFNSNSPQYSFAKNDLAIASADAAIKWIIVGFHTPVYTSPSKHPPNVPFRETYHPLFDKYDVDLVLQAHNHNYQRSYPITFNNAKSSEPLISSSQKNDYKDPAGEIYLVVGTAGRSLYSLNGKASFNVDQFEEYGFLDLEISNDGKILNGKFYSDKGGSIEDQFTITK